MKKLILAALLLVANPAGEAWADMYPDASNAVLPAAITKLVSGGVNLSAVTAKPGLTYSPGSMDLAGGGWRVTTWWGAKPPQYTQFLFGSKEAPVTAGGSAVAIGFVQAIPKENCFDQTAATGCNSALLLHAVGTSASTMVTSALTAMADTQSTAGNNLGNAQAGNFIANASASAVTGAMGIYAVGIRQSTASHAIGAEISAQNDTQTDCPSVDYFFGSDCMGIHVAMRGPSAGPDIKLTSVAIQVGRGNNYGKAREGLVFVHDSLAEKTINDQSSSITSVNIGGTHDNALLTRPGSGKILINTHASHDGPGAFAREFQFYAGTMQIGRHDVDAFGPSLTLTKSRHASIGFHTAVQVDDTLGQFIFGGSDGTSYVSSAQIITKVDNPVLTGRVPTSMAFWTMGKFGSYDERMRLDGDGLLHFGYRGVPVIDQGGSLPTLSAPRVVFVGDSLTFSGVYDRFVVLSDYKGLRFSTQNIGVGGSKVTDWQTSAPTWLDPLFQYRSPVNIAMIWLGTNDISLGAGDPPATVWNNLKALAAAEQRNGFKVCVGTMISRVGHDTELAALNGLIVGGWAAPGTGIDCLVDFGADVNLAPDGSNYSDTTYYSTDQVHLNSTGQALAGSIAQAALNTYIGTLPTAPSAIAFNTPGAVVLPGLPASAGAGGLYACVDTAGVVYRKATCP